MLASGVVGLAALVFVIALANHALRHPWANWLLHSALFASGVIMVAVGPGTGDDLELATLSVVTATMLWLWLILPVREALAPLFTHRFDPRSPVHMLAPALLIMAIWQQMVGISDAGGVSELVSEMEAGGMGLEVAFSAVALVIVSLAGVGVWMRRGFGDAMRRLGLRLPDYDGLTGAVLVALGVLGVEYVLLAVWASVDPEGMGRQSSSVDALLRAVDSWGEALVVAAGAAIGEEVLYRGALQPVFGLWGTSLFFALSHVQYWISPALVVVFGIALAFGWLRERYDTMAAVIGHFVYDLAVIAVSMLMS